MLKELGSAAVHGCSEMEEGNKYQCVCDMSSFKMFRECLQEGASCCLAST